jgi:hypothetical protein
MNRIYHTWDKWECYPAGFYNSQPPKGLSSAECLEMYRDFLADIPRFQAAMVRVVSEWKNSCEHYLSNECMNRIAWLGQSAMCIETGVPAQFRGGYNLLTEDQKKAADEAALAVLNIWMKNNGEQELDFESAQSKTIANLY